MSTEADKASERDQPERPLYEPPRVETVLSGEDIAREVLYAGEPSHGA